MISNKIATLPRDPKDRWLAFTDSYDALPTRATKNGRLKAVEAHSSLLPNGLIISSTFSATEETGRVSLAAEDRKLIHPSLESLLAEWGWQLLIQGTDRFVFKKTLDLVAGKSSMSRALPLILERLGVEPNQDWVQ